MTQSNDPSSVPPGKPPRRPVRQPPPPPSAARPAAPGLPTVVDPSAKPHGSPGALGRRPRKRRSPLLAVILLLLAIAGVGSALGYVFWPQKPELRPLARIEDQLVDELAELRMTIPVTVGDEVPPVKLSLKEAPEGLVLDEANGLLIWRPTEAQGPNQFTVLLRGEFDDGTGRADERRFKITVNEVNQPPEIAPIGEKSATLGETLEFRIETRDADDPPNPIRLRLLTAGPWGASIDNETSMFRWTPRGIQPGKYEFQVQAIESGRNPMSASQTFQVTVAPPAMQVVNVPPPPEPVERPPVEMPPPPPQPENLDAQDEQAILGLYEAKKLLDRREYPALRRLFAARFEREHDAEIKQGLGADYDKVTAWLKEHGDLKEELFTAIDPQTDKVPRVFRILADLIEKYPTDVAEFGELAIATAVVWDDERAVYDYRHHQMHTKSTLPEGQLGMLENFAYLVQADRTLQRVRYLPWEFLVHVVDHKTPLEERRWAVVNYLPARTMYGRCYKDVPYDYTMLKTDFKETRLSGKPYTLENLRTFGGVCAMQADFASRVGKSMGVPAAYVRGEARSGDLHAWVMWVELKGVTKDNISFSLESYGRYFGDRYYVGQLEDPHTGRQVTDRQLEVRLHTVGLNPLAKRHAALVMKGFPPLREKLAMDVKTELAFLNGLVQLCPGNEEAWRAVAALSKDGRIEKQHHKAMMLMLDKLFLTFAAFPDFTWEVFDDLIAFQTDLKQRGQLYGRLVGLYEQAGRPDLACEARLKFSDELVADGRQKEAVEGLAFTIKKFPDEGRYVPRMLDKIEAACKDLDKNGEQLVRFYQEFLPLVPPTRDDRPSPYCISMYRRAAEVFRRYNRADLAQMCDLRVQQLEALGKGG